MKTKKIKPQKIQVMFEKILGLVQTYQRRATTENSKKIFAAFEDFCEAGKTFANITLVSGNKRNEINDFILSVDKLTKVLSNHIDSDIARDFLIAIKDILSELLNKAYYLQFLGIKYYYDSDICIPYLGKPEEIIKAVVNLAVTRLEEYNQPTTTHLETKHETSASDDEQKAKHEPSNIAESKDETDKTEESLSAETKQCISGLERLAKEAGEFSDQINNLLYRCVDDNPPNNSVEACLAIGIAFNVMRLQAKQASCQLNKGKQKADYNKEKLTKALRRFVEPTSWFEKHIMHPLAKRFCPSYEVAISSVTCLLGKLGKGKILDGLSESQACIKQARTTGFLFHSFVNSRVRLAEEEVQRAQLPVTAVC